MAKKLNIETPGEEPTAPVSEVTEPASEAVAEAVSPTPTSVAPTPVVVIDDKQAQVNAQVEVVNKNLVGSVAALDWSHLTQPNIIAAKINPNAPDDGLPNDFDIDPAKIPYARTVLTKQGHVCSTAPAPDARR